MNKIFASTLVAIVIIGGSIALSRNIDPKEPTSITNVSTRDGKQYIDITAKGGYSPRNTVASANVPTILKIDTHGTFDCSSAVRIPSLNYSKNLPSSGTTEVEIPPQKPGTKIQGLCAMGMYSFSVMFN